MVVMFGTVIGTAVLMYGAVRAVLESQARSAGIPKLSPLAMPATAMPPTTTASPFFGGAPEPKLMTDEPSVPERSADRASRTQLHALRLDGPEGRRRADSDRRGQEAALERGLPVRPDPVTDAASARARRRLGESSSGRNVTANAGARSRASTRRRQRRRTTAPAGRERRSEAQFPGFIDEQEHCC